MILTIDSGEVGALMLLDMSATFDTMDHGILLNVLRQRFAIEDAALDWFTSYLVDRSQVIVTGLESSSVCELKVGTPQGSVLGPRLFVMYAEDVSEVFQQYQVQHHIFADDMQGTKRAKPSGATRIAEELGDCASAVKDRCASKRLQLNTTKTELLWYGSTTNIGKLSTSEMLVRVGPDTIEPSSEVRDLGVYFDSELNMKSHIRRVAKVCFYHLRRLRTLRNLLGREATIRLVSAFILSRLDYCNAVLVGLPASTLAPLQRVMHAAARLVCDLKPSDHVNSSLCALHWLPVKQRIEFKLCLLVHHAVNGRAPSYLCDLIKPTASVSSRASLRSASNNDLLTH